MRAVTACLLSCKKQILSGRKFTILIRCQNKFCVIFSLLSSVKPFSLVFLRISAVFLFLYVFFCDEL